MNKPETKEMRLFDIAPELREAIMSEDEGMEDRLGELAIAFENKAVGIVHITNEWEAFVTMAKAEEKRVADKRKAVENRIAKLKDYLKNNMETAEIFDMTVGNLNFKIQNVKASVIIENEAVIPQEFKTIIPASLTVNKTAIKKALDEGQNVAGASLKAGTSLRIR
jgi:hypothetical protein